MNAKEEFADFYATIQEIKSAIHNLAKYKGNQHYKKQLSTALTKLNRSHKFLKSKVANFNKPTLSEKFNFVDAAVGFILSDIEPAAKLKSVTDLEKFWPDLEVEFENLKLNIRSFEIPEEMPMTEHRLDLEEAIKDFDNGCFISALVCCRRAYEGALVQMYKSKTAKEPQEDVKCQHCKKTLRSNAYMGITKLHNWAIENKIVTERLRQVGFLVTDMGAGAAHPPLKDFPRDKELASLGITATLALMKEIYTVKS